jgi:hypothetical protein
MQKLAAERLTELDERLAIIEKPSDKRRYAKWWKIKRIHGRAWKTNQNGRSDID